MIVICREVDKETGRIAIYPIEKEVTGPLIEYLRLRSRLNEDLRYFATMKVRWSGIWQSDIIAILKKKELKPEDLDRLGGIAEI